MGKIGAARRILKEASQAKALADSFGQAIQKQKEFVKSQKKFIGSLRSSNKESKEAVDTQKDFATAVKDSNQEVTVAAQKIGVLNRAYAGMKNTWKKYGIEISGAAAATQLLRIEQRDAARGIKHYYKTADRIPTTLNKTGSYFENIGKVGTTAYDSVGDSLSNLMDGEVRKSYHSLSKMAEGEGSLVDAFLGKDGAMGAINASRNLAIAVGDDAHTMAQKYNYPVEAVRDLQDQIMDTLRTGTGNTAAYAKEIDKVADRLLFAKKVLPGIDEGEMLQFVNRSMWEFGETSEEAASRLTDLGQYVELSNTLLQKQGKLTKGATAQWKDDYAKAVMEASMSSKSLFLNTEKLSTSMMAASHSAHKMGLSYSQAQRVMKGVPQVLEGVPKFLKDKIGGSFLSITKDAGKYEEFLSKLPEKQRAQVKASIDIIKKSGANELVQKQAMYDVVGGTGIGQKMAFGEMMKVGGASANASLMQNWTGMDALTSLSLRESWKSGDMDAFEKLADKKRGKDDKGFDQTFQDQATKGLGPLVAIEDLMGQLVTYAKEASESRGLLSGMSLFGGGKGVLGFLGVGGGGAAAAGGGGSALASGGGGAALAAGGGGAAAAGGGVLASGLGMIGAGLGTSSALLTVGNIITKGAITKTLLSAAFVPIKAAVGSLGSAALTAAPPLLALKAVLVGSAAAANAYTGNKQGFLELWNTMNKHTSALSKMKAADIAAGDTVEGSNLYTGATAARKDMVDKIAASGDLAGMNGSELAKHKSASGSWPIGMMLSSPGQAADIYQALMASGASPEAIADAVKIKAAARNTSVSQIERVLNAAKGLNVEDRAAKNKKDKRAKANTDALKAADRRLQETAELRTRDTAFQEAMKKYKSSNVGNQASVSGRSAANPSTPTGMVKMTPDQIRAAQVNSPSVAKIPPQASPHAQIGMQNARSQYAAGSKASAAATGANALPLKAAVNNMGKLTLTLDSFYDLLSNYDAAKTSTAPHGTGVPR